MFNRANGVWHLVAAGADPTVKNARGRTARDLATAYGHNDVLKLFDNDYWLQYASEVTLQDSPRRRVELSGAQLRDFYAKKRKEQITGPAQGDRS